MLQLRLEEEQRGHADHSHEEQHQLHASRTREREEPIAKPQQDQRRDQNGAGRVAEPPREPNAAEAARRREASDG